MAIRSTEIHHRDDFPLLCLLRKYETIVEVGVDKGLYSELFLSRHWLVDKYCGVDPYTPYDEMPFDRGASYLAAVERYRRFPKATLIRMASIEAADMFERMQKEYPHAYPQIGMVYIDGCHSYAQVREDLLLWWPLLRSDGMLAGHDYTEEHPGVIKAVEEFAHKVGRQVYTTWSDGDAPCHSWYIYNDQATVLLRRESPP